MRPLKPRPYWAWKKVRVGPTSVSPMGFRTLSWGNQLLWGYDEYMDNELRSTLDLALENGINLFDSADSYGTGRLNGQSERLLGKFIKDFRSRSFNDTVSGFKVILSSDASIAGNRQDRDDVVIATKFAAYPRRLTPGQFVDACRASLRQLQIDRMGIGQLHWSPANYAPPQERALWDGLVAMCDKLRCRG